MQLISNNHYGKVYIVKNQILKIVPEFQCKEIFFWTDFTINDKKKFLKPNKIYQINIATNAKNPYHLPKGCYYFIWMKKKKQTLLDYMNKNNQINEKNWIFQIWVLLSELKKQKFVHCDVHLENILIENGDLFLIDFGLVMHEKYLKDSNQKSLCDLYLWSFEDFFSFIKNLIFYKKEAHLIKNNDYQKSRRTWRLFFQKNPKSWIKFKKLFITMFDFKERDDYKICFHFFVNTILSDSPMISPKQGVYKYDILCNIFLDRMFLLFFIIHSPLLSLQRRRLYIHSLKLIHKIIN